jgi:hypothetical protein
MRAKSVFLIGLVLTMFSCKTKVERIKSSSWKYQDGYHIGDVIEFETKHFVIDDSCRIFINGKYSAKVESVSNSEITIISDDNIKGSYVFLDKTN